jgi:hypothetical protein
MRWCNAFSFRFIVRACHCGRLGVLVSALWLTVFGGSAATSIIFVDRPTSTSVPWDLLDGGRPLVHRLRNIDR